MHLCIYLVERETVRVSSSGHVFWRWVNFLHRTSSWFWNFSFFFLVVIPWCSPLSVRYTHIQIDRYIDTQLYRYIDRHIVTQIYRQIVTQINRQIDSYIDRQIVTQILDRQIVTQILDRQIYRQQIDVLMFRQKLCYQRNK